MALIRGDPHLRYGRQSVDQNHGDPVRIVGFNAVTGTARPISMSPLVLVMCMGQQFCRLLLVIRRQLRRPEIKGQLVDSPVKWNGTS
jgi:hypothetical protein